MGKIRILLAEDHVVVRQGIRRFLDRESDLEVVGEASDGEEAIQLAARFKPDVLVMDIAMPKLNGVDATRKVKEICPATAVLALTAYDYDQYIFALMEAGAAGYLLKDVNGQELIEGIRAVNKGDSVLHPTVARKILARFRNPGGNPEESGLLTDRELEVLKRAARGLSNREIADELFLSVRTIEAQLAGIFDKLGVGSRTEAVVYALKKGWFVFDDLEIK